MLVLGSIRENLLLIKKRLAKRNLAQNVIDSLDVIIELDNERKSTQTKLDAIIHEQKGLSKNIGQLYRDGNKTKANELKEEVVKLKTQSGALEARFDQLKMDIESMLLQIPNVPHESVPNGYGAGDNEIIKDSNLLLPEFQFGALPHWELAKKYGLIDFEMGTKITGSGFPLYRGKGAKLQRALISFFLDKAADAGYEEILPPHLVNAQSAYATGQLPDKEGQMYHVTMDELYLIPTAEVPITNIYRDTIVSEEDLPIKMTGYTPCFRREAGSYGSDVKGLNRVHQFDKVELVQISHPDESYKILKEMVGHVEKLLIDLNLPYRILRLCGGDLGFTSALTYDFEVYSAAQKKWLEVSSVSNFEDYQSNRLKLRFKDAKGKKQLAHTLNGSALALARIVATLLENYQTPNGIEIPKVLKSYTNFEFIN